MTPLSILVAEDDAMIAMFLSDVLAEMGHVVCASVETEQDAVSAAQRYRPDLMIFDVNLREGTGIAAVVEIVQSDFVPHIFLSGDPYALLGLPPGAVIVRKPFMHHELARAIAQAIRPTAANDMA